jgi:hypothetical protein
MMNFSTKVIFISSFLLLITALLSAQVGIGTATPSSKLEVVGAGTTSATTALIVGNASSTIFSVRNDGLIEMASTTQGFLPPRVALTATNAASPISSPATGLLVYNTQTAGSSPNQVTPGYYFWNGTAWLKLTENGSTRSAAFVGRGEDVILGNLKVRMAATGNASLQVSTVSGTIVVYGSDVYSETGTIAGNSIDGGSPLTITTTPAYLRASYNFTNSAAVDVWTIRDTSNSIAWRITLIVGNGHNNNMISIERLL